jgi:aldose 1-epimerase
MQLKNKLVGLAAVAMSLPGFAAAAAAKGNSTTPQPDKNGKYWIKSDSLKAGFVAYGASISDLYINDKYGIQRDIVAGWDNATYYTLDGQHPHYGNVPGRYANRIKNSTFEIDGETYHVEPNEHPTEEHPDGVNTLHGGPDGWGYRNFTVTTHTDNSVTFKIVDPDGKEGFPGEVISYVTYTLDGWDWDISIVAISTEKKTPIMLTSHTYWNLDGFANNETQTALNHTLSLPYSGQRVAVDNTRRAPSTTSGASPSRSAPPSTTRRSTTTAASTARATTTAGPSTASSSAPTTGAPTAPSRACPRPGPASRSTSTRTRTPSRCTRATARTAPSPSRSRRASTATRTTSPAPSPSTAASSSRSRTTSTASTTRPGSVGRSRSLGLAMIRTCCVRATTLASTRKGGQVVPKTRGGGRSLDLAAFF